MKNYAELIEHLCAGKSIKWVAVVVAEDEAAAWKAITAREYGI